MSPAAIPAGYILSQAAPAAQPARPPIYSQTVEYERPDGSKVTKSANLPSPTGIGVAAAALAAAGVALVGLRGFRVGILRPRYIIEDFVEVRDSAGKELGRALTHAWEVEGDIGQFVYPSGKLYIGPPTPGSLGTIAPGDIAGPPQRVVRRQLPRLGAADGGQLLSGPVGLVKV